MTITTYAMAQKSLVGSCATHKRRRKRLGSGRSLPKAASDHYPIAGIPLAASKQWRNFGRSGPAATLFAIASPTFQTHRCLRLLLVAFGATPKFGSPE